MSSAKADGNVKQVKNFKFRTRAKAAAAEAAVDAQPDAKSPDRTSNKRKAKQSASVKRTTQRQRQHAPVPAIPSPALIDVRPPNGGSEAKRLQLLFERIFTSLIESMADSFSGDNEFVINSLAAAYNTFTSDLEQHVVNTARSRTTQSQTEENPANLDNRQRKIALTKAIKEYEAEAAEWNGLLGDGLCRVIPSEIADATTTDNNSSFDEAAIHLHASQMSSIEADAAGAAGAILLASDKLQAGLQSGVDLIEQVAAATAKASDLYREHAFAGYRGATGDATALKELIRGRMPPPPTSNARPAEAAETKADIASRAANLMKEAAALTQPHGSSASHPSTAQTAKSTSFTTTASSTTSSSRAAAGAAVRLVSQETDLSVADVLQATPLDLSNLSSEEALALVQAIQARDTPAVVKKILGRSRIGGGSSSVGPTASATTTFGLTPAPSVTHSRTAEAEATQPADSASASAPGSTVSEAKPPRAPTAARNAKTPGPSTRRRNPRRRSVA